MTSELTATESGLERLPPQSVDAEQAVLGALLVVADGMSRVVDVLEPDYFYRKSHQVIYAAMVDLYEHNEPIDIVTVAQYLKDGGSLEHVGGRQYIADLAMSVATTANLEYYARVVYEKSLLRNLIKAGTEIVASCYDETDADSCIDKAEHLIFNLAQRRNLNQLVHIKEIVSESFARIEQRYENRDALAGVPSGFYDLDAMTSGFQSSDLIVVAARPSMGKTAFCLNIAQHIAVDHKTPVAIFSLEMSKEQLVQRMLCSQAEIDANRLRTGFLQNNDWTRLARAMGYLGEAPIYIDDSAVVNALEIRAKCRRLKAEMKSLGLVIVDYIQLMQGRKQTDNRVQEVSEISRSLKTLARELEVPVIALSQLSRAVEARQNKRPMLSDLRESGCLAGETLVYLPDTGSYERIDSLTGKSGFRVLAVNQDTWQLEPRVVERAFATGIKPVFSLKTRLGRTIRATANHKFLTLEGWRRLDELSPGSRIAAPRALSSPVNATMKDDELALLGYLIGDGCTLARHVIQYTTADNDLAEHVSDLAISVFGDAVTKWLDSMGVFNLRSFEKRITRDTIPMEAWRLPVEPARQVVGMTTRQTQAALGMSYCGSQVYKNGLSRHRATRVARAVLSHELSMLAVSDVYWDEIVSIESDGETEVYDLTVEGLHNFVANNLIVHNSIEQDADLVMFIYRDEYYNPESEHRGEAEIIIAKQRNGPTGTVDLLFQPSITRFLNKAQTPYSGG